VRWRREALCAGERGKEKGEGKARGAQENG